MAYNYEIYSKINKFKGKDRNRLHMPGHKNAGDFVKRFPVAPIDFTELSFSDDLSLPTGAIAKAQEDIAEIVGAKRVFITTDGSSSGVMAMVWVASRFGNKLIVPRNSHKSVFNACRILGVEPVIVQGAEREGVLLPPAPELIEKLIVNDVNISGMIVATPDYYGNIAPLEEYANALKKHGRRLFCDGAHGAHLALEENRFGYCGVYADMWVDGAHKTLPTLTQGAYVCVNDESLISLATEAMSIFRTTSPSYPVMASVEYGVKYYINNPKIADRAKTAAANFKAQLPDFTFYPSADWTKLSIDFKPLGISPDAAQAALERKGIYPEMNDGRYLLFYLSPSTLPSQLNDLKSALLWLLAQKKLRNTFIDKPAIPAADRTYSYLYALRSRTEWVNIGDSIGRMCAENAGITPPCIPVIIAGEIISPRAAEVLERAKNTFGIVGGKIKVVKK
ncbi:MAG: aminotransferase class I/II-fold pyridoxal phosphate-dependent enzyme [Candidatus Coproplasma sp.]